MLFKPVPLKIKKVKKNDNISTIKSIVTIIHRGKKPKLLRFDLSFIIEEISKTNRLSLFSLVLFNFIFFKKLFF